MSAKDIALLRSQRFNRIQLCRAPCGPKATDHSNDRRDADTEDRRPDAEEQWKADQERDQPRHAKSSYHAEHTADSCDHDSFDQKLRPNVFLARADGFTNSNLLRPLSDRNQHDVHDYDATHD